MENGEQVVLKKGYLPKAIRASSAYPTLLTPVEFENKILVDGGIVNNFPVDEVLAMGADIIIGVDVSSNSLKSKDQLQSLPSMIDQIVSYQMITEESKSKKDKTSVYIRPDISEYSVTSFKNYQEIIEKGKEATLPFKEVLGRIASKQSSLENYQSSKIKSNTKFKIEQIYIKGNKHYS